MLIGCNIAHFKNKRHQLLDDNGLLQLIESQFMFLLNFILHPFSNFIQMKHAIYLLFLYLHNETFSFEIIWLNCLFYILYFYEIILIYLIFSMFCSAIYVRPSVAWRAAQQVPGNSISSYLHPPATQPVAYCTTLGKSLTTLHYKNLAILFDIYLVARKSWIL